MSNARVFNKVREIQRKEINKTISSRSELELLARNRTHRIIFFFPLSYTWQMRRWDGTYTTQISKTLSPLRVTGKTFSLCVDRGNKNKLCGCHGGKTLDGRPSDYRTASSCMWLPTFRRKLLYPLPTLKTTPCRNSDANEVGNLCSVKL